MSVLETLDFQPMLVTDVFESMTASKAWYDKSKLSLSGVLAFPFVSRTKASNGIDGFCPRQDKAPEAGGAITIGLDTQTIGYQPVPFYTSQNIQVLRHERLNARNALVLASLIQEQMGKFSWGGNGATLGRLKKTRIMAPSIANADGTVEVDWEGMDRLGAELLDQVITHTHSARETCLADDDTLSELRFAPMFITDVFDSMKASKAWYDKRKITAFGAVIYPFVSRTKTKNGIDSLCSLQEKSPESGNAITIGLDTQTICYQPVPFYTSQNIQVLRHESLNENNALVLASLIQEQMGKFSWGGNGATLGRLKKTRIMVPVITDASGEDVVDWDGMSAYGRALRVRTERVIAPVLGNHW